MKPKTDVIDDILDRLAVLERVVALLRKGLEDDHR